MVHENKDCGAYSYCRVNLCLAELAQAYSSGYGTGNNQPSYFDKDGALHSGNMPQPQITPHSQAPQNQVAAHRRGLTAFGSVGRAASGS